MGHEQMGHHDAVGLLMATPRRPAALPSIQLAVNLGRPIQLEDFHKQGDGSPLSASQFMRGVFIRTHHRPIPLLTSTTPVQARLDAGRWIADCPIGCGGAEMVSQADPVFLCLSCGSGDMWWPVSFPGHLRAIEAEVAKRGDPHGWAWNPGETVAQLRAETRRLAGS